MSAEEQHGGMIYVPDQVGPHGQVTSFFFGRAAPVTPAWDSPVDESPREDGSPASELVESQTGDGSTL
jgi:hypothetical protein